MILESKTDTLILEEGEVQGSTNMEIDQDSHMFLMRMLSKFYSDGVGSLIRETASNALDSHRECGSQEPIVVSFIRNNNGNYEFSVEDFGCGIDDQDVANIISKYGKSTKRFNANALGAYGLGFKSPLAYTSSFYFVGRKGGIERKWMLYESDDETNKIDCLYETPTKERNGVKIIVPVKWNDSSEFNRKMKEQLAYFEGVYFNCDHIKNENIKIFRHEEFQWSSLVENQTMHICLDNVYYPIDFAKLGINPIYFPVALRFSLTDGLFPIPNREQLKYTKEAKDAILAKIKKVSNYFVEKYNESIKDGDDIFSIMKYYQTSNRYIPHFNGINQLDVKDLAYYADVKFLEPKLNGIQYLSMKRLYTIKDYLLQEYVVKYTLQNGRFASNSKKNTWRQSSIRFDHLQSGIYYTFTELSMLKKKYLRDTLGYKNYDFIRKEKHIPLGNVRYRYTGRGFDNYVSLLELWNHPKSEWRERIKECQKVISLLVKTFADADKIEIPSEWIEGRKKQRLQKMIIKGTNVRRKKLSGEVTGKIANSLERYVSGKNCKFTPTVFQMADAHKMNKFIIYGGTDKEPVFQQLFKVLGKSNARLLMVSDRELKNLKDLDLHNWMNVNKFMEGDHIIFKRAVTAYLINKLVDEHTSVFTNLHLFKKISVPLYDKLVELNEYQRNHHTYADDELYTAIVALAEDKKLFDYKIYPLYKEIKFMFDRLPFLKPIFSAIRYNQEDLIGPIRDLFKYYKQRIDWQHYTVPVIEEQVEEEVVEEQLI